MGSGQEEAECSRKVSVGTVAKPHQAGQSSQDMARPTQPVSAGPSPAPRPIGRAGNPYTLEGGPAYLAPTREGMVNRQAGSPWELWQQGHGPSSVGLLCWGGRVQVFPGCVFQKRLNSPQRLLDASAPCRMKWGVKEAAVLQPMLVCSAPWPGGATDAGSLQVLWSWFPEAPGA